MRKPRPRACLLVLLPALALVGAGGGAANSETAPVVVTKTALFRGHLGNVVYGLVLRNTSQTGDAFGVTVTVKAFGSNGHVLGTDRNKITMIPAATNFYFNGFAEWSVAVKAVRISTLVQVNRVAQTRQVLPTFTHLKIDSEFGSITGSLRNPYAKRLPVGTQLYALFFNKQGRIIDTGTDETTLALLPHQSIPFTVGGDLFSVPAGVTAQVSVDPCSAFVNDPCPISIPAPPPVTTPTPPVAGMPIIGDFAGAVVFRYSDGSILAPEFARLSVKSVDPINTVASVKWNLDTVPWSAAAGCVHHLGGATVIRKNASYAFVVASASGDCIPDAQSYRIISLDSQSVKINLTYGDGTTASGLLHRR